ncbi:MAG: secretin N-terminal domain-containing protein [Candidatus Zixiibacteriota bacterium]
MNIKKITISVLLLLIISMALYIPVIGQEETETLKPIKNLQFQSADIRSVLTFLADYGKVNVVVSPDVTGSVTIKLSDIEWRTAMEIIGHTYDLAVVDEENGYIRVLPAEDYRKEVTEQEKHNKAKRELAQLQTKIIKISNSTSDDIVKAVKSLMTDRGVASSDSRSNSIIIQEVPSNMQNVLDYISELDKPANQIKISTRLLELYTSDIEELGIDWTAAGTYTTQSGLSYPQTLQIDGDRTTDFAGQYKVTALQHGWSVDALVDVIVKSNKGRIIAHPEITTIDNKQARIQMGQKIPVKQFDEAGNVVIKFEEVGTILMVTPHMTAENRILLELAPERSTYQFDPNGVIINTSNAQTTLIVANGQTAVIGGLTTEDEVESEIGVPILKDIPIIGRLFKYTNKRVESRDLIIFVTPTIVEDDLAMGG